MTPAEAATQLCTCVHDCNVPLLRRFIKAGILVNAGNFDSRTALHVAAAEGNVTAVRLCDPCYPWLKKESGGTSTLAASLSGAALRNLGEMAQSLTQALC
jgi:hypothetical protein